jgi:hypothetical protein
MMKKKEVKYLLTLTDAIHDGISWSANGSFVHRETITLPENHTQRQLWTVAKRAVGYTGVRGRYLDYDTWMPYRTVMMLHLQHEEE